MRLAVQKLTLAEYLTYDDGTDNRYELVDGELIARPPETDSNNLISLALLSEFFKLVPLEWLRHKDTEIVIPGDRPRVRIPDLMLLTDELLAAIGGKRATITLEMPAPTLVVEVVSPGKANEDRDYVDKRFEYAARGILEYWIVDPIREQVTVLNLVNGIYEAAIFTGKASIQSLILPELNLSAAQILRLER